MWRLWWLRGRMLVGNWCLARWGQMSRCSHKGCLQQFRQRLIEHGMDRRLLKRTIELAREIGGFDWRKLPKTMQVGIDSRPLVGAGRVEDTFNLLGHAARKSGEVCFEVDGIESREHLF